MQFEIIGGIEDSASGYVIPKDTCEHINDHVKIDKIPTIDQACLTW